MSCLVKRLREDFFIWTVYARGARVHVKCVGNFSVMHWIGFEKLAERKLTIEAVCHLRTACLAPRCITAREPMSSTKQVLRGRLKFCPAYN